MKTKDWRITNQDKYLKNLEFKKTQFSDNNSDNHDHCVFCWEKFSNNDGDLKFGYLSLDNKYWVCENCFNDFKNLFNLKIINHEEIDYRYETKNEARNFHQNRRAFIIYNNTLEFLPYQSEMSHFEYCSKKGIHKDDFNELTRGYYLSGNLVFYKNNFIFDDELISDALNYIPEISAILNLTDFNIYFGQIPEENFKLDLYYGKFLNGKIIKNN